VRRRGSPRRDVRGVELEKLSTIFGRDRLYVELQRHRLRGEDAKLNSSPTSPPRTGCRCSPPDGVNLRRRSQRRSGHLTCLAAHETRCRGSASSSSTPAAA